MFYDFHNFFFLLLAYFNRYFVRSHMILIALFSVAYGLNSKGTQRNGIPKRNGIMDMWMKPIMKKSTTTTTSSTAKSLYSTDETMLGTAVEEIRSTTMNIETTSLNSTVYTTTTERNIPISCKCGVFLASQIKRGSNKPPNGHPVIVIDLPNKLPCNTVGQKQCQTKCLQYVSRY